MDGIGEDFQQDLKSLGMIEDLWAGNLSLEVKETLEASKNLLKGKPILKSDERDSKK